MKVCAYLKSFLVDGSSPDFEPCFYDPFGRWLDQDLFPKATPRTPLSSSSSPSQQKQKTIPWKTHFPYLPIFFLAFLLSSPASHQLLHCSPLSILKSLNHRHGDGHLLLHAFHAAHFLEARSSLQMPFSKCFPSGRKRPQNKWNENIYIYIYIYENQAQKRGLQKCFLLFVPIGEYLISKSTNIHFSTKCQIPKNKIFTYHQVSISTF